MDLPKKESTFVMDYIGEDTGFQYDGTFTIKNHLNIGEKRALEIEKSILMADLKNPTQVLTSHAHVLANLKVRIINGPNWWIQSRYGAEIEDEGVIVELYKKVMEAEDKWLEELREKNRGLDKANP